MRRYVWGALRRMMLEGICDFKQRASHFVFNVTQLARCWPTRPYTHGALVATQCATRVCSLPHTSWLLLAWSSLPSRISKPPTNNPCNEEAICRDGKAYRKEACVRAYAEASQPKYTAVVCDPTTGEDVDIEASYTFRVRSTLDDADSTTTFVDFLVIVGDGCEADTVHLVSGISDTIYDIRTPSVPVTLDVLFEQSIAGCDLTYSVNLSDGASVDPAVITQDPLTGALTIETDDAAYFGETMEIVLKVTSNESGNEATADFILSLRDYCYGTELTAPSFAFGPEDVEVWDTYSFTFDAASESIGQCGGMSYEVVGISDSSLYSITDTTIVFSPTLLS